MATVTNHIDLERSPLQLTNDGLYETVNGQRIEVPVGAKELFIGGTILEYLRQFLRTDPRGWAVAETLFRLRDDPRLERRPDVAFVPYDRWPGPEIPETDPWPVCPALAVEVVSRSNTVDEIQAKIHEYFAHGAVLVWVVHPRQEQVHVYESPKHIRVLDAQDTLDGGMLLPGFRVVVAKLFEGLEKPQ